MSAPMAYKARVMRRVDWVGSFASTFMKYSLSLDGLSLPSFSLIFLGTRFSVESGWMLKAISLPRFNSRSWTHSLGRDIMYDPLPVHWTRLYPKSFSAILIRLIYVSFR